MRLLKQIAVAAVAELKIVEAEIEINLVSAEKMAEINWQFLKHEGSTDVITFDYSRSNLSGEIFICIDDAIAQAKRFKTSWQSEIARYLVHGILHLAGYDDLRADLRRKMKREENASMRALSKRFSLAEISRPS
ncbi:MAG TPA: rRNA maturation RNase YbeY [Verrucomicrobiae bacterium]|nr:rRNA maturation RNase YbeY [Verrucomicrobiae bacterium]